MAGWFQVHRWGQRWRGSTCVCLRVCVLRGCITCWHTAASKSSLVCLKQDDEICRRAPNARAAVTLNHSHTSNPHAVTQHTPTHTHRHTDTHKHTEAPTRPRYPMQLGPLTPGGRQQAGSPSARGHQPPGQHFILRRNREEGVWCWWEVEAECEAKGGKKEKQRGSGKRRERAQEVMWLKEWGWAGSDSARQRMDWSCLVGAWLSGSCKYRVNIS